MASCIEILIIFVQLATCNIRGVGVYYNQKLKWIDKKGIVCYNSKREARNRLALVCVLPGQTGLYRFKLLKGPAEFFTLKH